MRRTIIRLDEEGGKEKRCPRCGEWWPADKEFFFTWKRNGKELLHSWCKACYLERRAELRKRKKEVKMEAKVKLTLSKTIRTNKSPDIVGFIKSMKDMGAKVSRRGNNVVVIDFKGGKK